MKKITKILFVVAIMFIANLTIQVSAKEISLMEVEDVWGETSYPEIIEDVNVRFTAPNFSDITPQGTSKPSSSNVWSWSIGSCPISGSTSYTDLYTDYVFTGTTMLRLYITRADETFSIQIYQVGGGFLGTDKLISTGQIQRITADQIGSLTRIATASGLSAGNKYYVKIIHPAHFSGVVGNN